MIDGRISRAAFARSRTASRAGMAARALTAIVGGYAATSGIAALSARLLPIDRAEATVWAMILSFLVFAGLVLWSFHEQRLARVVATMWGLALLTIGTAWLLGAPA